MKNRKFLIIPVLFMGMSLASCDLKTGTFGLARISKYSHEVSCTEFAKTFVKYVKESNFGSESYELKDSIIKTEIKESLNQKVTNNAYKNSTRNEAKLKTNADAKFSYDADNETIDGMAKVDITLNEQNALLGKAKLSYENTFNLAAQPNGKNMYALIDKDDEFFFNLDLGEGFSLNKSMSELVREGVKELNKLVEENTIEKSVNEFLDTVNKEENRDVTLKFYADNQILTVVLNLETQSDLQYRKHENNNETVVKYGKVHANAEWVVQLKLGKVLKLVTGVKGKAEGNFTETRSSLLDDFIPTFSGLVAGNCVKGDKEQIDVEIVTGISLEQKDVTNTKVDLTGYREIK